MQNAYVLEADLVLSNPDIIDNNVEGKFENIPVKTLRSIQSKYLEKVVVVTVFQCFEEIKRELSDKFNSVDVINIEEFLEK